MHFNINLQKFCVMTDFQRLYKYYHPFSSKQCKTTWLLHANMYCAYTNKTRNVKVTYHSGAFA
jgi:hypothetical protein